MKTTFVSTYSLANEFRTALPRLQSDLVKAGKEVSTGRHADVGLELGTRTKQTLVLRQDYSQRDALIDSNGALGGQLERMQSTLTAISEGANRFLADLVSFSDPVGTAPQIRQAAEAALSSFTGLANTTGDGTYLLGGINNGTAPLAGYSGAPKLAVDTAFATAFGLAMPDPQQDPGVAGITPAAMETFLDNDFAALFDDPAWTANWSSSSDTNLVSLIAPGERIEISANANEPALRKLAMAYTMAAKLGTEALDSDTLQVVVAKAREIVGSAIADLSAMQSGIGFVEQRVATATERMTTERDIITRRIGELEGTDPVEAKVQFDTLSTQIEMSYALTSRVLGMSILNYA